jgi:uncharacterized protein YkwD
MRGGIMFRKLWKQLKILVLLIVIIICIPKSILPKGSQSSDDLKHYIMLNDSERRLSEYKDNSAALELKLQQIDLINNSRKKFNAKPVKLDILASRVANKMSREAAEKNFVGHWNTAGEKPYHRYAFAGGNDHISENAYGEWSSENYDDSPASVSGLMKAGHETFMAEKAPNDGHKKTVIDKEHNFVGIGYHLTGMQFRYYEEFIDRYFEFENIPAEVKPGEKTSITVRTNGRNFLYFMIVYYEGFPRPMNPKEISRKGSYQDFTDEEYQKMFAWDLAKLRSGPFYKIPLSFSKEGLYYFHIYSFDKEITKPATLDTRGKIPYSGIVIKVKK